MQTEQFVQPKNQTEKEVNPSKKNQVVQKSWDEFRSTGLFLFVNQFLQIFGWCLILKFDLNNNLIDVFPARVIYRGFKEEYVEEDYIKLTNYMAKNAKQLKKEVES